LKKIERDWRSDEPREVAEKEYRPFQDPDQERRPPGEIPVDRSRQARDPFPNRSFVEQDLRNPIAQTPSFVLK
jgi:hypothetical protein